MKKTLKILMAIILFAVVLTIATSVNAAATDYTTSSDAFKALVDKDGKLDVNAEIATLKVDSAAGELDLNGVDVEKIEVLNEGSITVTDSTATSAAKVTLNSVEVKDGGNFTLNNDNITVTDLESNDSVTITKGEVATLTVKAGNVTLTKNAKIGELDTDVSLTFDKTDIAKVKVTKPEATVIIKENITNTLPTGLETGSDADIILVTAKGIEKYQIFTNSEKVTAVIKLKDENGKEVTGAEKGDRKSVV